MKYVNIIFSYEKQDYYEYYIFMKFLFKLLYNRIVNKIIPNGNVN